SRIGQRGDAYQRFLYHTIPVREWQELFRKTGRAERPEPRPTSTSQNNNVQVIHIRCVLAFIYFGREIILSLTMCSMFIASARAASPRQSLLQTGEIGAIKPCL